ncbi:hypothetical protein PI126_g19694 [Phytophthora idaei]|nr:hypothetical protein PI126_g19694 [Phytophthora idaei]
MRWLWSAIYGLQGNEIWQGRRRRPCVRVDGVVSLTSGVRRSANGGMVDNVAGTSSVVGGPVRVGGGSLSASSGLAGDAALSGGVASIGAATGGVVSLNGGASEVGFGGDVSISSGAGSLCSGASASGVAFSGSAMIGSGESVDDASGMVTLSSGSSEASSSGDVSMQCGVAATVAGRVSVLGGSTSSSTGSAVAAPSGMSSDVSGLVSVESGAASASGDASIVSGDAVNGDSGARGGFGSRGAGGSAFVRWGSGGNLSHVQGNSSVIGADVELVGGGVDSTDADRRVRWRFLARRRLRGVCRGRLKVASKKNVRSVIYKLPTTKVDERCGALPRSRSRTRRDVRLRGYCKLREGSVCFCRSLRSQ